MNDFSHYNSQELRVGFLEPILPLYLGLAEAVAARIYEVQPSLGPA